MALLCVGAVALVSTALAWACSPQANIFVGTSEVNPGQRVSLTGSAFVNGPVEIHWGSAGGPIMTTIPTGPSFTTTVTVPATAPGTYYITAIGRDAAGVVKGTTAESVEVLGTPTAPATGAPSGGKAGGTDNASGDGAGNSPAKARSGTRERSGGNGRADGAGGTTSAPVTQDSTGTEVFAGSVPATRARSDEKAVRATKARPSERSAAADLWGGFASGKAPLATANADTVTSAPGSQLALGTVLLGLGLLSLLGGLGLAGARRRARARVPGR